MGKLSRLAEKDSRVKKEDLDKILDSQLGLYGNVWLFFVGALVGGMVSYGFQGLPSTGIDAPTGLVLGIVLGLTFALLADMTLGVILGSKIRLVRDYLEARETVEQRKLATNKPQEAPPESPQSSNLDRMSEKTQLKFDKDIELKIIDLVAEELRSRFFTSFGAYLSALVAIMVAFLTLSLTGTAATYTIFNFIALPVALIVGVVVFVYAKQAATEYREQLHQMDDLIEDVRSGRSLGTVKEALRRIKRRG